MATEAGAPTEPGGPAVDPAGNRRGRETRRRILAVAAERFEAVGVDLTLDEVARAAGTTRMTVHRHTGGREPLLTHLVLRATVRLADEVRATLEADRPFPARLEDALVGVVVLVRQAPHLDALVRRDPAGWWPVVDPDERVLRAIHDFFRPYLQEAAAAGELRSPTEATLDWLLRQVLVFLVVPDAAPDEASVREQVRAFVLPAVLA